MRLFPSIIVIGCSTLALACGSKDTDSPATPKQISAKLETPADPNNSPGDKEGVEADEDEKPDPPKEEIEAKDDEVASDDENFEGGEKDPSATAKVTPAILEGDDLDTEFLDIPGHLSDYIAWTDKYGTSAVFITTSYSPEDGHALYFNHMTREGDSSWTSNHKFQENISTDCPKWQVFLSYYTGDWSIPDLTQDSLAEATVAWSYGCRADLETPLSQKVAVVSRAGVNIWEGKSLSETFTTAPEEDVAESFTAHAKKVWAETANEPPPTLRETESEYSRISTFLFWEQVGDLRLEAPLSAVEEKYGKPEHLDSPLADDDNGFYQTYFYPSKNIELILHSTEELMEDAVLAGISFTGESGIETRSKIGIGSTREEANKAYEGYINTKLSNETRLVIGVEDLYLSIRFEDDKVVSISFSPHSPAE